MGNALTENVSTAAGIAKLLETIAGSNSTKKETTSGGGQTRTDTKQTMLSEEAINELISQMMKDPSSGLAKVASGARGPGMYNTTSQQLMVNDLISRAAGQAALASAPTTTTTTTAEQPKTTTTKIEAPGALGDNGLGTLALLGGGAWLLGKNAKTGKSGMDVLSESISGFFGNGATAGAVSTSPVAADMMADAAGFMSVPNEFGGAMSTTSNLLDSSNLDLSGITDVVGSVASGVAGGVGDAVGGVVADVASGAGDLIGSAVDAAGDFWDEAVDWVGSWF